MENHYDSYQGGGDGDAAAINIEHEKEIENIKRTVAVNKEREIEIEDINGTLKK
ncbi:hypothetical protein A2U01_0025190, partial [Trifolium medium]|nr:hypothetical protein [Trifolium medium]